MSVKEEDCVFCRIWASGGEGAEVIWQGNSALAIACKPPKMEGHTLIVPRLHVPDVLDLDYVTYEGVIHAAKEAKAILMARLSPAGFNFGANIGEAAGQTMPHGHYHLMPRYEGDCPEQRGVASILMPWYERLSPPGVEHRPPGSLRFELAEGRNFPP